MASTAQAADPGQSSYVPGFSEDLFISYRHLDNTSGWVTALHDHLLERLPQILGRRVRIWRDRKLDGADALWEVIEERLDKTALLISVLSPAYMTSQSCAREVTRFFEGAKATGGIKLDHRVRFVRVLKTPYGKNLEPAELTQVETLGYQFFKTDPQDETSFEEFPPDHDAYKGEVERLAQGIAKLLNRMREASQADTQKAKTAFVASTNPDRKLDREMLINTLRSRGFQVAVLEPPPESEEELTAAISSQAKDWDIAVHIVGGKAGLFGPLVKLEYEAIRTAPVKPCFRQFVWVPEDLKDIEPRQQQLIDLLLNTVGDEKTEVLHTGRTTLIDSVSDSLRRKPPPHRADSAKSVYLLYTEKDMALEEFKAIRKYLLDHGIPVEEPAFEGEPAVLEKLWKDGISSTDAALIYYGSGQDGWVQNMRVQLRKTLATLNLGEKYLRSVYLSPPPHPFKTSKFLELPTREVREPGIGTPLLVLGDCGPFIEDKLQPLLARLDGEAA